MPIFRTKHSNMQRQLREKSERVRNIHWYWNFSELLFRSYSLKSLKKSWKTKFCIFIIDKSKEVIFVTLDMLENEG